MNRELREITTDELTSLFKLARGLYNDASVNDVQRISSTEILVRQGYGQYVFGMYPSFDNDVRVPEGISFYMDFYLIKQELEISENGLEEKESQFNDRKSEKVRNQSILFGELLKMGFEITGLTNVHTS